MASAFKLFPADETATGGEYGTSPYGTSPYGGTQQGFKYVLPANEVGGDDPERSDHRMTGVSQHRRAGRLLGERKYADWRVWDFQFTQLEQAADLDALVQFYIARRFKFLQNATNENVFIAVNWVGTEWHPVQRRGGLYELSFSIEER